MAKKTAPAKPHTTKADEAATAAAPAPDQTQEHAGAGEAPVAVAIIVTAKTEGFRRAGRAWSRTPTRVEIDELTEGQLDALVAETMLDVTFLAE